MKGDSLYMCQIIDFASYKNKNSGIGHNFAVASSSSRQQPLWQIEKEKINQDHAFVNDAAHEKRKHAPDAIKDINDINRIIDCFLSNGRYRDLLLFVMGISFGLRCGDLLQLKFGHIMDIDGTIKNEIILEEEKTRRKEDKEKNIKPKRGHIRTCYMNDFVVNAARLYIDSIYSTGYKIDLNDYLFTSLSNNNSFKYYNTLRCKYSAFTGNPLQVKKYPNAPIGVDAVADVLNKVMNDELGMNVHAGTHLMRKTFAYQVITNAPDRSRAIELLQRILGHKSPTATLYYAGITGEEIQAVCKNLYKDRLDFCYGIGLNRNSSIG